MSFPPTAKKRGAWEVKQGTFCNIFYKLTPSIVPYMRHPQSRWQVTISFLVAAEYD